MFLLFTPLLEDVNREFFFSKKVILQLWQQLHLDTMFTDLSIGPKMTCFMTIGFWFEASKNKSYLRMIHIWKMQEKSYFEQGRRPINFHYGGLRCTNTCIVDRNSTKIRVDSEVGTVRGMRQCRNSWCFCLAVEKQHEQVSYWWVSILSEREWLQFWPWLFENGSELEKEIRNSLQDGAF